MNFTSLWYFPFLTVSAIAYHFTEERFRLYLLLFVSWGAYMLYGVQHFFVLIFVTIFSYMIGRLIEYTDGRKKKLTVIIGSICIILLLFLTKYKRISFYEDMILPIGISFYSFQALSYMIDIYHGERAEHSFVKYSLYICFFPQLVAGPIEHADTLISQFRKNKATGADVRIGICYLISGCVRKFVIADYMEVLVDRVYGTVDQQSGISLLLATIFFAFQIYGDFSGYTHIAIGSARMFGVYLTENFKQPYLATGCRDFWKRWHITLTQWFTKYIYIPLGGKKRKYRNIMIVFLLSGIWHGANLTFLVWGAYFGIWRIVEEIIGKSSIAWIESGNNQAVKLIKQMGTFSLVCVSWIFFRSCCIREAITIISRIIHFNMGMQTVIEITELAGATVRIGILSLLPVFEEQGKPLEEKTGEQYYVTAVFIMLILVSMMSAFFDGAESGFIYFQF